MSLVLLFYYLLLNMFRMLIHPSSGACDLFDELFHGLCCSGSMRVGVKPAYGYHVTPAKPQRNTNIKLVSLYSTMKIIVWLSFTRSGGSYFGSGGASSVHLPSYSVICVRFYTQIFLSPSSLLQITNLSCGICFI